MTITSETERRIVATYRKRSKIRQYQRGGRPAFVDGADAWAHVDKLVAEGWTDTHISRTAGLAPALVGRRAQKMRTETRAKLLALTRRQLLESNPRALVPSIGAVRRIRALQAIGWDLDSIGGTVARNTLYRKLITGQNWKVIAEAYDRLSMEQGPMTRQWKARMTYAPPLAWDDDTIDDPAVEAVGAR